MTEVFVHLGASVSWMATSAMPTDGEVLAELLCMIDNHPRPSLLFGAPALSVSQVETNLSLPPGALEAGRLKAIIEPLADSLFDKPRKVTIRDLHRGGNVEFWTVFEELALAERPSSAPKLARLPPLNPHLIASRQSKVGLDDRLKAVAAQDAQRHDPTPGPSVLPSDPSALTVTVSESGRDTSADIADVAVVEPSGHRTADSIGMQAQDQERGFGEQNPLFFASAPEQARSARLDSKEQVEPSAPLEHSRSVSPQPYRAAADLIAASDLTDFIPQVDEDQSLVVLPSALEDIEYDLKQGVNLDEDADGPTSYAAQSPVDAFEFDMVDLLSPADDTESFPVEMPRMDVNSDEENLSVPVHALDSLSPILDAPAAGHRELKALAPIAAPSQASTGDSSPQVQTPASGRPPQLEIVQPAGLVVDLDLPESSTSSEDQFEYEVTGSSSSSGPHDGQSFEQLPPAHGPDEAIENRQSLYFNSDDVKRAPQPKSVNVADWHRAEWSAQALLARPGAQDISPPQSDRRPHLAHYTSPLPSPRFLADRAQASRSSTPPPTRRLVVDDDDDYQGPHVEPFGSPVSPNGMQDLGSLSRGGQTPGEERGWHEENKAQHNRGTASTTSARNSSFSLDDLLPSATREQIDLASAQASPLSPPPTFTESLATSPVPATMAVEDPEDAIQETHSSPPTSPARTDVSGSEYESDSAPRISATRNPPQIMQNDNNPSQDASDSRVPTTPTGGSVETPPITPFVDKVFRDLPFAPRLPPALQPEALRQHGHWLAYELVAVLVVFLLLIPA